MRLVLSAILGLVLGATSGSADSSEAEGAYTLFNQLPTNSVRFGIDAVNHIHLKFKTLKTQSLSNSNAKVVLNNMQGPIDGVELRCLGLAGYLNGAQRRCCAPLRMNRVWAASTLEMNNACD